jgi:hypothetical protein
MALGISCGEAIFGGTAPLVATALVVLTGDSIAPGFYLMFCGFMGLLAVNYCRPVSSLGGTYSSDKHENIPLMPRLNYKLQ